MTIDSNIYMHELDRSALQALKAIPGFTQLLKAYMKIWSEQQYRIQNMATNLRISEKQMPKYYNMLPPICEKLGIEIPELYLKLDVNPNAYTSGDTKPFIVMTSGLLETLPEELIPSVLAHECGHIACHHVLYSTMGRMILDGTTSLLGLGELVSFPIQAAFYHWMRCSELSADRAAAICDGNADKVIETCMRFAGFGKGMEIEANAEAFMEQAIEYKQLIADSKWNKTLEFLMYSHVDHPLNAVRAYECNEWYKTENFSKITGYLNNKGMAEGYNLPKDLPLAESSKYYTGQNYEDVQLQLQKIGFTNIELIRVTENRMAKNGQVLNVTNSEQREFKIGDWYPAEGKIIITYYKPLTEEEQAALNPGKIRVPDSARRYIGRNYQQVVAELKAAGFSEIVVEEQRDLKKGWIIKEGSIARIMVDWQTQFEKGDWFEPNAMVKIVYHALDNSVDWNGKIKW